MEMMNRLMSNALDSQKFIDALKKCESDNLSDPLRERPYFDHENRQQRRARERAEAKAARKAKA